MASHELVSIPENPVPEGAVSRLLAAEDGALIRAARFPAQGRSRGTVCLFHGRTEFIEKYYELIGDLTRRGFQVATMDWRGQGRSSRARRNPRIGHVSDFEDYQTDLDAFVQDFLFTECRAPFFALAHSMSGPVLLEACRRRPLLFDRLVLSAPMLGLAGAGGKGFARGLARWLNGLGLGFLYVPGGSGRIGAHDPFAGNVLTSDPVRYARVAAILKAAPDLGIGAPSIRWLAAAYRAMRALEDRDLVAEIRTPVLILSAARDSVVSNRAQAVLANRLVAGKVVTLDGALHELLLERDSIRDKALAAFDAFVPGSDPFPGPFEPTPL